MSARPSFALRPVPHYAPSDRARCTWALRKIRNLATTLRTQARFGLLPAATQARLEEDLWAAIALRKQLEVT